MAVAVGDPVILARLPGYRVATTTVTSDSATLTSTEASIASVTASLISGVKYKVQFEGGFEETGAAQTGVKCLLRQDSLTGTIMQQRSTQIANAVNSDLVPLRLVAEYTAASTGSKTFVVGATCAGSNVNLNAGSTFPAKLYVEVVE